MSIQIHCQSKMLVDRCYLDLDLRTIVVQELVDVCISVRHVKHAQKSKDNHQSKHINQVLRNSPKNLLPEGKLLAFTTGRLRTLTLISALLLWRDRLGTESEIHFEIIRINYNFYTHILI